MRSWLQLSLHFIVLSMSKYDQMITIIITIIIIAVVIIPTLFFFWRFGSWPPDCRDFETLEFLEGEDFSPKPIPNLEGQDIYLCPTLRSEPDGYV